MTDELYEKIVIDAAQYDLMRFIPMLNGEPFCDPKVIERIAFARKHLKPSVEIRLFTNGSLITREQVDMLATMRNVRLSISMNGHNTQTRQDLMGISDFDQVSAKLKYIRDKGLLYQTTAVWFPSLSPMDINLINKLPLNGVFSVHNFAGELYAYNRTTPTNCERVRDNITAMVDGKVCLCCFDSFGKVIFGNLCSQTLEEVWKGPEHQRYLDSHLKKQGQSLPLCKNCTQG